MTAHAAIIHPTQTAPCLTRHVAPTGPISIIRTHMRLSHTSENQSSTPLIRLLSAQAQLQSRATAGPRTADAHKEPYAPLDVEEG